MPRIFKKNNSYIYPTEEFIYEVLLYKRESNIISIQDSKTLKSKTYIPEKTIAPKKSNTFTYIDLIGAPEEWLYNNGYIEIDSEELIKRNLGKVKIIFNNSNK